MADDQEDMAKRKGHSTFGQAINIGKRYVLRNMLRSREFYTQTLLG